MSPILPPRSSPACHVTDCQTLDTRLRTQASDPNYDDKCRAEQYWLRPPLYAASVNAQGLDSNWVLVYAFNAYTKGASYAPSSYQRKQPSRPAHPTQ